MKKLDQFLNQCLGKHPYRQQMPSLGPREIEVLKMLWRNGELSAQQLLDLIDGNNITLSTMQSTLERLHRKQLVNRSKSGRSYRYTASIDQSTVISCLLQDISSQISDGEMAPMVSGFMSFVSGESASMSANQLQEWLLRNMKDNDDGMG